MRKKKMLNEGNQIHNLISSSGSGTVINYGSSSDFLTSYGSTRQKVAVHTVPVPQHCSHNQCCGTVTIYYGSGSGSDF
jgi:hypothetical protein